MSIKNESCFKNETMKDIKILRRVHRLKCISDINELPEQELVQEQL